VQFHSDFNVCGHVPKKGVDTSRGCGCTTLFKLKRLSLNAIKICAVLT
jgi:hypothetical protein